VVEEQPEPQYYPDAESSVVAGKRKLGEYEVNEEEDAETFKFQHKDKRPVRDPYDDDEWDPKKALGGLKIKTKEQKMFETKKEQSPQSAVKDEKQNEGGLDREKWSGRLELQEGPSRPGMVFAPNGGGWVKTEGSSSQPAEEVNQEPVDQKPSFEEEADVTVPGSDKAQIAMQAPEAESETAPLDVKPNSAATETETPAAGLFKKRRPPPSNRKK
jgi:WW domain-binding protein 4